MSSKNFAIGAVITISLITLVILLSETFLTLQGFNTAAAVAAVTVAAVGIVWFKKTAKS